MKWSAVEAPPPTPPASAIKAGMGKGGRVMTLYFTAAGIDEYFGGVLTGRTFTIESAFSGGQGHLRITPDPKGIAEAVKSLRNSARIRIARFATCLPDVPTKGTPCHVIEMDEDTGAIILRLPDWASAPPAGAGR